MLDLLTMPVLDPTYTTLAYEQDERWTFRKLMLLFFASLMVPLGLVWLAAKIIAG